MSFSLVLNNDTCPECKGQGVIITREETEESIRIYGPGHPVDVAHPCPSCAGGHSRSVETIKERSAIPESYSDKHYDAFNWDIYLNPNGYSVDMRGQKKFVDSFINDFDKWEKQGLGLYIWSPMKGSGKTFLASCICNELIEKYEVHAKFVSAASLISMEKAAGKSTDPGQDPISVFSSCRLLVIDDLMQNTTQWFRDIMFRITDERMQKKLVTLVTSNIKLTELTIDERVGDRLNRICQPLPLPNYCVRAKESYSAKREFLTGMGLM